MAVDKDCVFCKIVSGQEGRILYQDEKVIVFEDIRPAAQHHYLICPNEHIPNAKCLTRHDIPLVEHMLNVGRVFFQQQNADLGKARFGFHWPPFISVNHLHLHAISPDDKIKLRFRLTGDFSLWSPWFKSVDWLIRHLRSCDKPGRASAGPPVTNGFSNKAVPKLWSQSLQMMVLLQKSTPSIKMVELCHRTCDR